VVLVPDYRSSGDYGWQPLLDMQKTQTWLARDCDDVLAGVDYAVQRGLADPQRLALFGHSAGAYRTNWIITHDHRFTVAVSKEGWGDEYLEYGESLSGNRIVEWAYQGKPWEAPENYFKDSPVYHVRGATIPTMFISGEPTKGGLALYSNQFLYTALKQQGVETAFIRYPDEGHNITRPENRRDVIRRILAWVDKFVGDGRGEFPLKQQRSTKQP